MKYWIIHGKLSGFVTYNFDNINVVLIYPILNQM